MIARLIVKLRMLRAYWQWLAEVHELARNDDAVFAADTAELKAAHPSPRDCPTFDCRICLAMNDPRQVGRQQIEGDAIKEIARWLVANGWTDMDWGYIQQYAAYLRRARADYEKAQVTAL